MAAFTDALRDQSLNDQKLCLAVSEEMGPHRQSSDRTNKCIRQRAINSFNVVVDKHSNNGCVHRCIA